MIHRSSPISPDDGEFFLVRRWHGERYRSIDLDGFSKWIIKDGTVINRKPSAEEGGLGGLTVLRGAGQPSAAPSCSPCHGAFDKQRR